jgi:hypothetical protein
MSHIITPEQMAFAVPASTGKTPDLTRESLRAKLFRPAISVAFVDIATDSFDTTATFDDLNLVCAQRGSILRLTERGLTLDQIDEKLNEVEVMSGNVDLQFFPNSFGVKETKNPDDTVVFVVQTSPDHTTTARIKSSAVAINGIFGSRVAHEAKRLPLAMFTSHRDAVTYSTELTRLYNFGLKPKGVPLVVFGKIERQFFFS